MNDQGTELDFIHRHHVYVGRSLRIASMTNACRHFLGMLPDRKCCEMGRDIRKNAINANGGSSFGIGLRLPCTAPMSDKPPLFDCPDQDRQTDDEVAEHKRKVRAEMDITIKGFSGLRKLKEKMVDRNLSVAKATCVWCEAKDALKLSCNIKGNKHLHVKCDGCGRSVIE